jgi:CheY-like chemotaxis protein
MRILVVDDEIYIRELLIATLSQLGYKTVDTASDGADAWDALHEINYCLVITDHKMPRLTGLELIARMRAEGMSQPVILTSGTMPTHELNRQPDLRVDAMLLKPFTVAELAATIGHLLRMTDNPIIPNQNPLSQTEEPAATLTRDRKNQRRILVVDDDQASRQLQIDLLKSSGYHVEAVTDGAAGWAALRSQVYDLVITDNHMPKMTGLEMIEKLHFSRRNIPVIMATGILPMDAFARKPWLRPEATLQKPFTNRDLLEKISNVLDLYGGNDDPNETLLPKFL